MHSIVEYGAQCFWSVTTELNAKDCPYLAWITLSLRKTRMRVIFDYVVESGHFVSRGSPVTIFTIMPPSHTLKDTTNHGGIYKCTQPTGKQKTIHSHGHVHVQICLTKHACDKYAASTRNWHGLAHKLAVP